MKPKRSFCNVAAVAALCVVLTLLGGCTGSTKSTTPTGVTVSMSIATASVQVAKTMTFTATVANDSGNKGVTWALSGAGCTGAACGTLSAISSASGVAVTYAAPATVPNPATVTLTATSAADPTKSAAVTITLTASSTAVSVSVAPAAMSVAAGGTQAFTATVSNDSQNKGVTWTLSGAGCSGATCGTLSATSSASGTPITYIAPATAPTPATVTLTATSVTDTAKSGTATITLAGVVPTNLSVAITPRRGGMTVTGSQVFTATVTNDVGNAGVNWTASAGTFGNQTATTATFTAPATASAAVTITATSKLDGGKSASATIGVTDLTGVTTYHNDLSRDGVNAQEYALTTSNVTIGTFGKLFSCTTDGAIYAQPLWVANVTIGGAKHNVVVAATAHDSVYVFDADASPCVTYWHANLLDSGHGGTAGETSVPSGLTGNLVGNGFGDIVPEVGVIGTPVIDSHTGTIYVVSKSVIAPSNFFQRIHALDLATGGEKLGGPVVISASVTGTGDGASGGNVAFDAQSEHQRPGLALVNNVVYIAWASHEDKDPYHGWVIGYSATNLSRVAVFNDSPNGNRGGIWMSGGAPAADANNNLYVITGNGTYDGVAKQDYGDSFLKLSTASGISVADWFTPADQATLEGNDTDFGSGGAAILVDQPSGPVQHLVIGGGKEGNLFLLNRDMMGHNNSTDQVVQTLPFGNGIFATAAFWNNSLYLAGTGALKQFSFDTGSGKFNTSPASQASSPTTYGFPGASPSISVQGASNGIVWAIKSNGFGANSGHATRAALPAELHAYDATNLATELWNSTQVAADAAGNAVKFTVPTVANGKVYVGTRGNDNSIGTGTVLGQIDVYGLLPN